MYQYTHMYDKYIYIIYIFKERQTHVHHKIVPTGNNFINKSDYSSVKC